MIKRLKNRSLFFTTIMIVLLLVAALSTATFAWFSANNIVNVSSISFMADSNEGHGELAISWDRTIDTEYRIDFALPYEDENRRLYPMMPIVIPTREVTTFSQFAVNGYPNIGTSLGGEIYNNKCFTYGIQGSVYDSETSSYYNVYQYDGDFINPYICKNKNDLTQNIFYVINKNTTYGQDITIEYSITGGLADKLCVAVFVGGYFYGILTNSPSIHYGIIKKDNRISDTNVVTNVCYASDELSFNVPKGGFAEVQLVAWYDGVTINNADAGETATLSMLRFKGEFSEPD